ncbi:MAG: hypothetical protein PHT07_24815, partial [Paludibacter sp.]|nr:hypothetical protein [Paludibacter sp.]
MGLVGVDGVMAAGPRLIMKTNPVTGGYSVGDEIEVVVWVNSEDDLSAAVDVWGTVDGSVLKIVGINEITTDDVAFDYYMVANTD